MRKEMLPELALPGGVIRARRQPGTRALFLEGIYGKMPPAALAAFDGAQPLHWPGVNAAATDPARETAAAIAARVNEVRALAKLAGIPSEQADAWVEAGLSVDAVRREILAIKARRSGAVEIANTIPPQASAPVPTTPTDAGAGLNQLARQLYTR